MSSTQTPEPAFRLVIDAWAATLYERGRVQPLRTLRLDAGAFEAELRAVGALVRAAGGALSVELPETEVWRGALETAGSSRLAQWRAARKAAAGALGRPPAALRIALGAPESDGRRTIAAVPRRTLAETRRYLESTGIAVAGFEVADALGPPIALPERTALPSRRALAAGGAMAAAASLALFLGSGGPASVADAPVPQALETAATAVPPEAAAREPAPLRFASAPPHRPPRPVLAPAADAPGTVEVPEIPALELEAPEAPTIIKAARDLPGLSSAVAVPPPAPRQRPDNAIRARTPDPAPESAPESAPVLVAALPQSGGLLRPLRRPAAAPDLPAASTPLAETPAPAAAPALVEPRPRPRSGSAALPAAISEAVATAQTPVPAPAADEVLRPEPRRLAARPAAPEPAPTVAPTPAAAPAPVRTAAVAPQPVAAPRVVRQPAPQPAVVRSAAPARERVGLSRRQVSLIGVFGEAGDRYALVRMPSGKVYRVRPGDQVDGARVAAVNESSVQLAGRGSSVMLSMR